MILKFLGHLIAMEPSGISTFSFSQPSLIVILETSMVGISTIIASSDYINFINYSFFNHVFVLVIPIRWFLPLELHYTHKIRYHDVHGLEIIFYKKKCGSFLATSEYPFRSLCLFCGSHPGLLYLFCCGDITHTQAIGWLKYKYKVVC
jgi:hypothetical protein